MKDKVLRKKLIIESAITFTVLIVLSGLSYYLGSTADEYDTKHMGLSGEVDAMTNEMNQLQGKYDKVKMNNSLYNNIMQKAATNKLGIDRDSVRKYFETYKTDYYLDNLRLSMGPPQERTGLQFKRPAGTIVASDVSVVFEALTDEDVYTMLQEIQKDFPGSIKMTQVIMTRENKVSGEGLRQISQNGKYPMVKGNLKFTWFGIKLPDATAEPPKNVPPPIPAP